MDLIRAKSPKKVIHEIINSNGFFPGNAYYPFLVYQQPLSLSNQPAESLQNFLKDNGWINSWVDGIYDYHHYHSNTHECLVVISGECNVQVGGEKGSIYGVSKGDVLIIPAGVSHKNTGASKDFKCIGAYPFDLDYDMNYGKADEHPRVDDNIRNVRLPKSDPIFGKEGPLFDFWKVNC
ncbi:cupin domain-containing protein [Legionella jordanis]|uniref:Cupin domain protein n=1 Tax=Legionella jordanis TaxID=456 RepID=A0A0W0VDW0_9GAMM|nr:cupin domain-containing protein [Legionella jordanis]KTD18280.1 Cupin domain protein [Legionella jordanis]RMX05198.1 cupin domain-containing protein [Legionella jordanis]RMX20951.1 cupin domain-containing protein [Legionella jordanis]VEH13377.1 Uncharacterized protein containing double-stranded beta helix domain [Legionella jordanis]